MTTDDPQVPAETPEPGASAESGAAPDPDLENWKVEQPATKKSSGSAGIIAVVVGCGCLLFAVPTVGILAAIAIPNFIAMQLRAKRAEAPTNLDGIRTAEKAYHAEWDEFRSAGPCPAFVPGRELVPFEGDCVRAFELLGWVPDGGVRCQYTAVALPGSASGTDDFQLTARCDIDGDGFESVYEANRASKSMMTSPNNAY